jgi:hypothetical protein
MTSSHESFQDSQAAIEHALLWDDITTTVQQYAGEAGIRLGTDEETVIGRRPTRMVLQSDPQEGLMTLLWTRATETDLVGEVTLSVQDAETCVEQYMYEVTPRSIVYYSHYEKKTSFARDDIETLRADLQELNWNRAASQQAGEEAIFIEL